MLASINPLGERSRNRTWWVTYAWYVAGSLLGGAVMGASLGAFGAGLDALLAPSTTAVAVTAAVLGAVALVFELHPRGLRIPTVRRQVDEDWIPRYRAWVYAGGFGLQLGVGVVTGVRTTTVYLTWAFAVLSGSLVGGLAIGLVFGAARALPMLLVA
ncbi:MAG: sulfite exporter TauE/SafE family protein, partial [Acidimicrobiia bacterium]